MKGLVERGFGQNDSAFSERFGDHPLLHLQTFRGLCDLASLETLCVLA